MNRIKVGAVNGKVIYTGDPKVLKDGEYYIQVVANKPTGLFVKKCGKLVPVCNYKQEDKELNLLETNILTTYHGKKEELIPSEGYDGIAKVTYKKPKLEEKDTVTITKNGITEIKVGKGYDGLDDVTIIVNVEE